MAYARDLYERRTCAVLVQRHASEIDGWAPVPKLCHDNVMTWVEKHPGHAAVHGWLYFDLGGQLDWVRFVAHSVIRDEQGRLLDITPSEAPVYPFVEANMPTEKFAEALRCLEETYGADACYLDVTRSRAGH